MVGGSTTGCGASSPYYEENIALRTPLAAGDFVGTGGAFCVDASTGHSFIPSGGIPGNDGDCSNVIDTDGISHSDGYFVNNNIGQNAAEFAAYLPELNANLNTWADAGYFISIDFKMRNLNDGGEQLWICSDCSLARGIPVPEPGTLALLSLGLLGISNMTRHRKLTRI